jgi:hypothetical protein
VLFSHHGSYLFIIITYFILNSFPCNITMGSWYCSNCGSWNGDVDVSCYQCGSQESIEDANQLIRGQSCYSVGLSSAPNHSLHFINDINDHPLYSTSNVSFKTPTIITYPDDPDSAQRKYWICCDCKDGPMGEGNIPKCCSCEHTQCRNCESFI